MKTPTFVVPRIKCEGLKEFRMIGQQASHDIDGFIKKHGGIRCRNRQELDLTVDSLLLQGVISKASFELETLVKKAKKLGLWKAGKLVLQKA